MFRPKMDQAFFRPKIFLIIKVYVEKIFWTKNVFGPTFFCHQKCFGPTIFQLKFLFGMGKLGFGLIFIFLRPTFF